MKPNVHVHQEWIVMGNSREWIVKWITKGYSQLWHRVMVMGLLVSSTKTYLLVSVVLVSLFCSGLR